MSELHGQRAHMHPDRPAAVKFGGEGRSGRNILINENVILVHENQTVRSSTAGVLPARCRQGLFNGEPGTAHRVTMCCKSSLMTGDPYNTGLQFIRTWQSIWMLSV
jgi:hypothetical protein